MAAIFQILLALKPFQGVWAAIGQAQGFGQAQAGGAGLGFGIATASAAGQGTASGFSGVAGFAAGAGAANAVGAALVPRTVSSQGTGAASGVSVTPLQAVLTDVTASVTSGTFTVPAQRSLIVMLACWQSVSGGISTATIGGHAATFIVPSSSGEACAIAAAMVDPGDPNTWSTNISPFSNRVAVYFYRVDGATSINSTASGSGSGGSSASVTPLNVAANSTFIGIAKARGPGGSWPITWSLLSEDQEQNHNTQNDSSAHLNYTSAATSQVASVSAGGGAVVTVMAAAVFSP